MKQRYIVIDVRWCHDCNNCFMSCKDEHVMNDWEGYTAAQPRHGHRWINIMRRERGTYPRADVKYLPMPCQHCENAPCMAAGKDAVTRREDGIVMIDMVKAKGNKELVNSCPYGAIYYNDEYDVPQKCTMCAHLLDDPDWKPAKPRCAHSCPTHALSYYYEEPEAMAKIIEEEGLEVYRPELGTNPHVFYKNLYMYTKNFVTGQIRVNGDCYENAEVAVSKDGAQIASMQTNFFGEFKFDGLEDGSYVLSVDADGNKKDIPFEIVGKSLDLGVHEF